MSSCPTKILLVIVLFIIKKSFISFKNKNNTQVYDFVISPYPPKNILLYLS